MDDTSKRAWSRGPLRVELRCLLEFTGPLHVGTGAALSLATDAPVLRDAAGHVWLPGSSVRGVLADWCHREAPVLRVDRAYVQRLFGVTPQRGDGSSKNDRQGRLTVLDVAFDEGTGLPPETARADVHVPPPEEIRDHVRINRESGAAARGGKFDHEVAHRPSGTLRLIYEGDSRKDPELLLLQSAADALQERLLAFGGKTGWGLGAARVSAKENGSSAITWSVVERAEPEALSIYLNTRLPPPEDPPASSQGIDAPTKTEKQIADLAQRDSLGLKSRKAQHSASPDEPNLAPWSWLRLGLRLAFDGPMLVAALDATVPSGDTSTEPFTDKRRNADATYQVDPQGRPLLAGSALRGPLRSDAERIQKTLGIDALAETLFGTDDAQGLIRVEEGVLHGQQKHVLLNHVSIDRVTGFAASARLFDVAALASPCFLSELLVRWNAADETHRQAVALLFFVLRDAEQQGMWIGSRTPRGYGHAKRVEIRHAKWSLVSYPNSGSSADGAQPIRLTTVCEPSITVSTLADCLGFIRPAWAVALCKARKRTSSPSVSQGVRSDRAD